MSYQDPYATTSKASQRLFKEWQKHPKLVVAVDFDDTVFDFHNTGNEHKRVIEVLKKCNQLGFYVVLWSASKPERFAFMREYATSAGIEIASINENPIPLPFGNDKKIYYNILLDDRAGLGQALDTLEVVIGMIENQTTTNIHQLSKLDVIGDKLTKAVNPASDAPETALYNGTHETHRINGKTIYQHAEEMERQRNIARTPICIGRPIIEILATEGIWTSINGNSVVAADCLFKQNPYQ